MLNYAQHTHTIVELSVVFTNSSEAIVTFNTRFQSYEHCPAQATMGDSPY